MKLTQARLVAITFAALVLTGAAFDTVSARQQKRRKSARPTAPSVIVTPAPAATPAKKNARLDGAATSNTSAASVAPRAEGDGVTSLAVAKPVAEETRYTFEFAQPEFPVSRYVIEHDAAGRGSLSFRRKTDGLNDPPVVEQFEISPAAAARILAAWAALNFLDSQESYQADKKFPHLGTMRLGMKGAGGRARLAEFNWTNQEHAERLVREYKGLAEQQLFVFDITLARQYQPSEVIKILKRLEFLLKQNNLSDAAQLLPLLRDLVTDERVPLIARNHVERLIKTILK